ncbi:hypothetical protein ACGYV8_32095 [Burkholderia pseudomallei]
MAGHAREDFLIVPTAQ